jgi:hypothetical protein
VNEELGAIWANQEPEVAKRLRRGVIDHALSFVPESMFGRWYQAGLRDCHSVIALYIFSKASGGSSSGANHATRSASSAATGAALAGACAT